MRLEGWSGVPNPFPLKRVMVSDDPAEVGPTGLDRLIRTREIRSTPPTFGGVPVFALPGGFDKVQVLQSNHPEIVVDTGIAVSTFPLEGEAHLPHTFQGDFEIFCHHQNRSGGKLHQGLVLANPGSTPVTVRVGTSASRNTAEGWWTDMPFFKVLKGMLSHITSGPGDRSASDMLRGHREVKAETVTIPPGQTIVLHSKSFGILNELTSQFRLNSDGPLHAAVVMDRQTVTPERAVQMLLEGKRLHRTGNDPDARPETYGRAAGVQEGARWLATLSNGPDPSAYVLGPEPSERAFLIDGVKFNTVGTGQNQAAPMLKRYPSAATHSHGNYGVEYELDLPLRNGSGKPQKVQLYMDSPTSGGANLNRVFRGTFAIETRRGQDWHTEYVHVSQEPGGKGKIALHEVKIPPGGVQDLRVRLVYPADATPPQLLRIKTAPAA